jgi:hypothetical protein
MACGQPFAGRAAGKHAVAMVTLVGPDPSSLPRVVTRQHALQSGLSRDQIRHRVRGGHWTALDTGVYLRNEPVGEELDQYAKQRIAHLHRCVAAVRRHPVAVIAYGSAAIAHGMPLVSGPPPAAQLIVPDGAWTGIRNGARYRLGRLGEGDVDPGTPFVTAALRTWVDVARTHSLADALSAGDRALLLGMFSIDDAADRLACLARSRGCRLAARALALIDGLRETPLESWSAALFWQWRLPVPLVQQSFSDDSGFIGRVDFYWPESGLVGEADGRLKYDAPGALYAEKLREDRLRAIGLTVIRWGWQDVAGRPDLLRSRLSAALHR